MSKYLKSKPIFMKYLKNNDNSGHGSLIKGRYAYEDCVYILNEW